MDKPSFGSYVSEKRKKAGLTLRGFAKQAKISPVYASYIEQGLRAAPARDILQRIVSVLELSGGEAERLYDLAAESKAEPDITQDLPEYIVQNEIVRVALRTAKNVSATDKEWEEFIERITNRDKAAGGHDIKGG